MVTITHVDQPINPEAVDEFESCLQVRLPDDYRRFLLEHNGGKPTPATFLISAEKGSDSVDYFLGLKAEKDFPSLEMAEKHRKDHLPSNMIAIADDPFGNAICLSIQGADIGKVYFWDADFEVVGAPDYSNLYLLADSFDEFLSKLY